MKTATFLKKPLGFKGDARLYQLSEPVEGYDGDAHTYVIVSAVIAYSGPETYIFPADEEGRVVDWGELPGSFQGGLDHELALQGAGYGVADES